MIFVDSNIPMYLIGTAHPHKIDAQQLLEKFVSEQQRLVTDAEVLQEILHRYVAIERRDAIPEAFSTLLGIVDEIFPVDAAAVDLARKIVLTHKKLSARGALHWAIMQQHNVRQILTFDSGFDGLSGIERLS